MSEDNYFGGPEVKDEEDAEDPNAVEIYSKQAIWGFTIFFSTLFGGILLMQNLRAAGYKKAGYMVLLFSIIYKILTVAFTLIVGIRLLGVIFDIAGGAILAEYFFRKYFPDDDYYPKPIWRALAAAILLAILLVIALSIMIVNVPGLKEQLEGIK
ncbi:MAG: hypothetical protein ABIP28_05325 [Mucilaginibacter sp.]